MVEVLNVTDFIAVVNKIKRKKSSNHITSLHLYTVYTIRYMKCHVDPNNT